MSAEASLPFTRAPGSLEFAGNSLTQKSRARGDSENKRTGGTPLEQLRARWLSEAAEAGRRSEAEALAVDDEILVDPAEALERLRRAPDPEVGSPWRRAA